jgi:hypothetical protein
MPTIKLVNARGVDEYGLNLVAIDGLQEMDAVARSRLIHRAVNAHEQLVEALRHSVAIHKAAGLNRFDVENFEQAIAKAEGK